MSRDDWDPYVTIRIRGRLRPAPDVAGMTVVDSYTTDLRHV
jgi:hypothetical protein